MKTTALMEVVGERHDVKRCVLLDNGTPVSGDPNTLRFWAMGDLEGKVIRFKVYSNELGSNLGYVSMDALQRLRDEWNRGGAADFDTLLRASVEIFTLGYADWKPGALKVLVDDLDALVVDVRISPRSRNPQWRQPYLERLLGQQYLHVREFGNVNYKGGPIEIVDPAKGLDRIREYLDAGIPIILMCVCRELATCHRLNVAHYIRGAIAELDVKIEHLLQPDADPQLDMGLF